MKFGTKVIHAGVEPDPSTGAIMTPIYQTSTYVQEEPGIHKGYEYSRTQNPTRTALQKSLAEIENGKFCSCFSSGVGAIDAVIKLLNPGDEVISTIDLYGGSYRLFGLFERFGIKFHFVDMTDFENVTSKINEKTKMMWVETPTNPGMKIIDIQRASRICKDKNILLCVDNTFASPYLQNPLDLGADLVIHSATKYLGGHSDVVLGAIISNDESLAERIAFIQNTCGAIPGPMDCFLVLRGIKTLEVRMKAHCENGHEIAHFLRKHKKVNQVFWPGFEDALNHEIAKKQMKDFGGMMSFDLKVNTKENAVSVLKNTKIFSLAESLGGVESLIGHPATMTHAAIPKEKREEAGITDSFIRLSIGIEDAQDLIDDLNQALEKVK